MRNLITQIVDNYQNYDEFKRSLESYHKFIKSESGKFAFDVLRLCQTTCVNELLTTRYTKLEPTEKDVQQRTIYQLNQILTFLMAPMTEVNRKKKKKALMGAALPNPTGGKK